MKKPLIKKIIISIAILLVICVLACGGSHIAAHYYANIGNLEMLSKALFVPEITKLFDPKIVNYANAGQLLMQDHYLEAKPIFDELGQYYKSEELAMECLFREAKYLAYEEQNYERSLDILAELDENGFENAEQEINKVLFNWAGYFLDEGEYITAYKLMLAIPDRSDIVEEATEAARKVVYIEGQKLYRNKKYQEARAYFLEVKPYSDSETYLELLNLHPFFGNRSPEKVVTWLLSIFEFEDADELLMSDHRLAEVFLKGNWRSYTGGYYFNFNGEHLNDNLPKTYYGPFYWMVENGELVYSTTAEMGNEKPMYQIKVLGPSKISIYCYQNKQTYTLYRH